MIEEALPNVRNLPNGRVNISSGEDAFVDEQEPMGVDEQWAEYMAQIHDEVFA